MAEYHGATTPHLHAARWCVDGTLPVTTSIFAIISLILILHYVHVYQSHCHEPPWSSRDILDGYPWQWYQDMDVSEISILVMIGTLMVMLFYLWLIATFAGSIGLFFSQPTAPSTYVSRLVQDWHDRITGWFHDVDTTIMLGVVQLLS